MNSTVEIVKISIIYILLNILSMGLNSPDHLDYDKSKRTNLWNIFVHNKSSDNSSGIRKLLEYKDGGKILDFSIQSIPFWAILKFINLVNWIFLISYNIESGKPYYKTILGVYILHFSILILIPMLTRYTFIRNNENKLFNSNSIQYLFAHMVLNLFLLLIYFIKVNHKKKEDEPIENEIKKHPWLIYIIIYIILPLFTLFLFFILKKFINDVIKKND